MKFFKNIALAAAVLTVGACSGGAGTEQNPNTQAPTVQAYTGPAAGSADVQAFKNEFWVNITPTTRCGGCHYANGQAPMFARMDDVNAAYSAALTAVNLSQPDQSRVVTKVAGGHNCWLSNASACADILTTWIRNWASASGNAGTGTQIQLVAPDDVDVGSSKTFPTSSSLFSTTVYPLLTQYCSNCHTPTANSPQKPYFASNDVEEAYAEVHSKINLDTPAQSRLVLRLRDEAHNCWGDCDSNANAMQAAIEAFAGAIPATQVDPSLVISKALTLYGGTVASGGNRIDTNVIARYVFKEGTGSIANDTSGVDPATNLTLSGSTSWSGGWGITIGTGGKAQVLGNGNNKLATRIKASGEYSIEAWVAPANVTQEDAYIVSYSGGVEARNVTLAQRAYQYEALARSSTTDGNGEPALLTNDEDRDAQASLQHVVLTYDPVNGRRLYVNGSFTEDTDPRAGGSLSNWDDTFALVLGNETSNNRQWLGLIKFVAIHDRALSLDQVQQNFAAGVGERYFLLFNVTDLVNVPQSYVMFEVSQYDSYAYLFNKPTFISLDPAAQPGTIEIRGLRIGINGAEARVGQAYIPLEVTVSNANYNSASGQLLSNIGTVIGLEKGPDSDLFFLSFEQIGSRSHVYTDNTVLASATPVDAAVQAPDLGYRTFDEIDATMSKITGVPRTTSSVRTTYTQVKQQLPAVENIEGFLSSHQVGIAQLGIAYCSALVNDGTLRANFFPGLNINTAIQAQSSLIVGPLVTKALSTGLSTQPDSVDVESELNNLIGALCTSGQCPAGDVERNKTVVKAACSAVLASAVTTIQ